MHATALRQVFLPLLCLLIGSLLPVAGSTVPHFPASDSLPSAPEPSVVSAPSSTELHPAVIHPNHDAIPRLESEPHLTDFLTGTIRSPAAKQMLRISDFIDRYPKDGRPATESTVAYLGYTREYFFAAFVCKDKTPGLIRAHMLARDSLGDDDFVEVMLDT